MGYLELTERREKWDPRESEVHLVWMGSMGLPERRECPVRRVSEGSRAKRETREAVV